MTWTVIKEPHSFLSYHCTLFPPCSHSFTHWYTLTCVHWAWFCCQIILLAFLQGLLMYLLKHDANSSLTVARPLCLPFMIRSAQVMFKLPKVCLRKCMIEIIFTLQVTVRWNGSLLLWFIVPVGVGGTITILLGVVWHSFHTVYTTDMNHTSNLLAIRPWFFFEKIYFDGGSQVISRDQNIEYGNFWLVSKQPHWTP